MASLSTYEDRGAGGGRCLKKVNIVSLKCQKKNCQTLSIECPNVKLGNDKPQDSYHNFNFYCI